MVSGTLYTYPENFRAYKILIAAKYSGSQVKVAPNFVFGETNKTPEFLKKFPLGSVPAFETNDGKYLTESNAIAYYVSGDNFRGRNLLESAEIVQWMDYADSTILPNICKWTFPLMGIMPFNKQTVETAKAQISKILQQLDSILLTRTFLVGDRITLADVVLACTMMRLYEHIMEPNFRQSFTNVNRWFDTIMHQEEVKAIVGNFQWCAKATEFDPKKYAQFSGKGGAAGKEKEKAKEMPPKEKQQKSAKVKELEEEMDATEMALAAEPESKDPFAALPQGTFVMDEFKRCYSNEDVALSIPCFWEIFDPQNYSIWFAEYKYNEELTKVFMSCNLISGMYQRLDKMRKQTFASMCLFGKDNDSSISGIWVWRGQGLAFELCDDWKVDYELYSWKKLDPAAAKTKDLVKQYLSHTGADKKGRPFNQGKIFK